jgi:hypothetical protein
MSTTIKRTKEALIAQHQARKADKGGGERLNIKFSFTQFPEPAVLRRSVFFLILGVAFFLLPVLIPDVGKAFYRQRAVAKVYDFELSNEVLKGQFKRTAHSGDTRPDEEATFMAVSILTNNGQQVVEKEALVKNIKTDQESNKNMQQIYQNIVQLKGLELLKDSVSEKYTSEYYDLILSLTERHSAFRLNVGRSASVSATYYAFQAIKELDKMNQFKQREEFNSAIHFVASMKDPATGGFRNSAGENATLLATWHAINILSEQTPKREIVAKAYENVAKFVFSCQTLDGGFLNTPAKTVEQRLYGKSSMAATSQALYILNALQQNGVVSFTFTDPLYQLYYDATSYLQGCLSLFHGVLGHFPSNRPDLEATYYFLRLADAYPNFSFGIPRNLQYTSYGVGIAFLLYALYTFYSPQILYNPTKHMKTEVKRAVIFLSVGAVALRCCPPLAIVVYLVFVVYLAIRFYDVQSTDTTEGMMLLIAAVNTFCFLGMVFLFVYTAPMVFAANLRVFYALGGWAAVCTFVVIIGAAYMTDIKKVRFYTDSAFLAWILNTVLFYSFVYGRGEMDLVYKLMVLQGHFPLLFVVLPAVLLVLAYAFSAGGVVFYFTSYAKPTKKPKSPKTASSGAKTSGSGPAKQQQQQKPKKTKPALEGMLESTTKEGDELEDAEKVD